MQADGVHSQGNSGAVHGMLHLADDAGTHGHGQVQLGYFSWFVRFLTKQMGNNIGAGIGTMITKLESRLHSAEVAANLFRWPRRHPSKPQGQVQRPTLARRPSPSSLLSRHETLSSRSRLRLLKNDILFPKLGSLPGSTRLPQQL